MMSARAMILAALVAGVSGAAAGQAAATAGGPGRAPESADAIMARVAENQDRSEAERAQYVYVQHAKVVSRRGRSVMCEEVTDSRVTPTGAGSREELMKLDGRMLKKGKYVSYNTPLEKKEGGAAQEDGGSKVKNEHDSVSITLDDDMDRELVENMRHNLTVNSSKDGIDTRLFPLTSKAQADYLFRFLGRERMNGREVFHVSFRPKNKDEFGWKGDAFIDAAAYEPVVVTTEMARKVPVAVRTLLGTDVPGLGFTIVYAPQPDGVWFPVSFGTEFRMHVLFFVRREIIIDASNRSFEKTHVTSKIVAGAMTP